MILIIYSHNSKEWSFLPQMLQKCITELDEESEIRKIEENGSINRSNDIPFSKIDAVIFINIDEETISKWNCITFSILPKEIYDSKNVNYRIKFENDCFNFKAVSGLPLSALHSSYDLKSMAINIIDIKYNRKERFNV